jgi:predicted RNase H-like nuclease
MLSRLAATPHRPQNALVKIVGLDFGWMRGESGVALLETRDDGATFTLVEVCALPSTAEVLAWLDARIAPHEPALVAVDAPTVIPEGVAMRVADKLTHTHFGRQHAGAYPANRKLPFAASTLALGAALESRGYAHAPTITPRAPGRFQIECFPHPAMLRLFELPTILRYKKGTVAERRAGLARLRELIATRLVAGAPALATPLQLPTLPARGGGGALKRVEDQLDAVVCAYVGAHWWRWGAARNEVLGDREGGYIVVPAPPGVPG